MGQEITLNGLVKVVNPYRDYYNMRGTVMGVEANTITVRIHASGIWVNYNRDDLVPVDGYADYETIWSELREWLKNEKQKALELALAEQDSRVYFVHKTQERTYNMVLAKLAYLESELL